LPQTCRFTWPSAGDVAPKETKLLFFTGRIDNLDALAQRCDVQSDATLATVLPALYEKFAGLTPDLILGDFVIALWDPSKQAVVCFRDVSGCGLAYYSANNEYFVIAETIEDVLATGDIDRALDKAFVFKALSHPYYHPERTYLKAVRKIPPAHIATITREGNTLARYWDPRNIAVMDYSKPDEVHRRFRALFKQAVQDRLPKHDNIGVHLSGGMDCTSVAILAAEVLRAANRPDPTTFAWQPPPDEIETLSGAAKETWQAAYPDEYKLITSAIERSGLTPHYCPITKQDCLEIWQRDDVIARATGAIYGEWPVQKRAKALGVKTILTGVGGDEVASFNGRGYLPGLALRLKWIALYKFAKATGRNGFKAIASELRTGLYALFTPEALLHGFIRETSFGIAKWKTCLRVMARKTQTEFLLTPAEKIELSHVISYLDQSVFQGVTPLPNQRDVRKSSARRAMRDSFERGHIFERIEGWASDGAKHGMRYEYPLLDKRILELCFALPEHAFQDTQHQRAFFRQAMAPILPELICTVPKGTEEARAGAGRQAGHDALIEFGNRLRKGDIQSPRLKYIDRERLANALEETTLRKRSGVARLLLAIQFIGMN